MTETYQFVLTNAEEQRAILEQFRLYGTKWDRIHGGRDTTYCLTLWYALRAGDYLLTSAYSEYLPGTKRVLQKEYIVIGKDCTGLVRCRIPQWFERIGKGGRWYSELPEIVESFGSIPCTKETLAEMIQFHSENDLDWERQFDNSERSGRQFQTRRERILEQPELWQGDLLTDDYRFVKLTEQEKAKLSACAQTACSLGRKTDFAYAMTDGQNRFRMVQCYFMADGIKHCGEPNDHGYAILTGEECGIVYIWHPYNAEFRSIEGSVPFPKEELREMIFYYDAFSYEWERMLKAAEGA